MAENNLHIGDRVSYLLLSTDGNRTVIGTVASLFADFGRRNRAIVTHTGEFADIPNMEVGQFALTKIEESVACEMK